MIERPKRRKYKDNPYSLNYEEDLNKYTIKFKMNTKIVEIEVNKNIYNAFNDFKLNDLHQMNEFDNHIEHLELDDNSLFNRSSIKNINIDEIIMCKINSEILNREMNKLPLVQQRRLKMYYFEDLNIYEIAKIEDCSHQAINKSIKLAIKQLNINLKNLNL